MSPRHLFAILAAVCGVATLAALGVLPAVTGPFTGAVLAAARPLYAVSAAIRGAIFNDEEVPEPAERPATLPANQAGKPPPGAYDRCLAELSALKAVSAENDDLRLAAGYSERYSDETVTAGIIGESPRGKHGFIIDRGTGDGIAAGQPVIAGGVIIGKIAEVAGRTATVTRLSDSDSRLAVGVQNTQGTLGLLEGDRGLSMAMTLIPQTERVAPGDIIITSGLEAGIRRGLIIGTVERVEKASEDLFQTAVISPPTSVRYPVIVSVIIGLKE